MDICFVLNISNLNQDRIHVYYGDILEELKLNDYLEWRKEGKNRAQGGVDGERSQGGFDRNIVE